MSTKRKHHETAVSINPLFRLMVKTKMPQEDADVVATAALIALDECRKERASNTTVNALTYHLAVAQCLWSALGNAVLYRQACEAWRLWCNACNRDQDKLLRLTTTEYMAVRQTVNHYLQAIPMVELARIIEANSTADKFLNAMDTQHAA
jgi:hypothetical protein